MNRGHYFKNWGRVVCSLFAAMIVWGICSPVLAVNSTPYHGGTEYWIKYQNRNRSGYPAEAGGVLSPYIWAAGCTPTAVAMVLGYWDNFGWWDNTAYGGDWGSGKWIDWGDLIRFYQDSQCIESMPAAGGGGNYTVQGGHWIAPDHEYSPDLLLDLANEMRTKADGGTKLYNVAHGINQVTSKRGYGAFWAQLYMTIPIIYPTGWTTIKEEISNDRPCVWHLEERGSMHDVAVWGYIEGGTYDKYLILYDTWYETRQEWPIDDDNHKSEAVITICKGFGTGGQDIQCRFPQSSTYTGGSTMEIDWYQSGTAIDNAWLEYSINGGCSWSTIVSSVSSSQYLNSYSWVIPKTINSSRVKIRIRAYQGNTLMARDGNKGNLSITPPSDYTLTVNSSGALGVSISSTTGHGGTTNYTRTVASGTTVRLTAPATVGTMEFTRWTGAVTSSNRTIKLSMTGNRTVTANYQAQPTNYTLTVNSSGASGVVISSTTGHGGTTNYTRTVAAGTTVRLTAPATVGTMEFTNWTWGITTSDQTIEFSMTGHRTVTANYSTIPNAVTISGHVRDSENAGIEDVNMSYGEPEKLDQKQEEVYNGLILSSTVERMQAFCPTGNKLCKVDILISKAGSPGNLILHIRDIDYQSLWNNVIDGSQVPQGESWVSVPVEPSLGLIPEETYRICVSASNSPDSDNIYFWSFGESGFAFRTYSGDVLILTDEQGYYRIIVWSGWSGVVTPIKEGYEFTLPFIDYPPVNSNQTNQHYTATLLKYTITATAGSGGSIDPSGNVEVEYDGRQTFTITTDEHYHIEDVVVDDSSVGAKDSYTFENVTENHTIHATFAIDTYTLTIKTGTGGTTNPSPDNYIYDWGTIITVTAIPNDYSIFNSWSGDFSGSANPVKITMDSDKSIKANFRLIYPPLNVSGNKILNRSLLQGEYINVLKWEANPNNQDINIEKYRIYQLEGNNRNLLVELDSGTFEYWHRNVEQSELYSYELVVFAKNREGKPVNLTIQ